MPSDEKFARQIDQVKEVNHRTMVKLAKNYHETVCDDYSCVVYEKKLPLIKTEIELYTGYFQFQSNAVFANSNLLNNMEFGINAYFWLPRTNERVLCQIRKCRCLYAMRVLYEIIRSPLEIVYQIPISTKVKSRISIGNTLYTNLSSFGFGVTGRGGISFLFDKAVSNQTLTTSFVIEHTRLSDALVLGYPVKSISVSFTVGIISLNSPFYYNF